MKREPDLERILETATMLAPHVHNTPVLTSRSLDATSGATLFFKCENFQRGGAFKIRGATRALMGLSDEELAGGVVTHSSGNFAAALTLAAATKGVKARVVMPVNSSLVKLGAVTRYGGEVIPCESTLPARERGAADVVRATGARFIHPFNDYDIIAGQGTVGLELCREVGRLDAVVVPVGGGGLISGTAIAVRGLDPTTRIIAAEPALADDAFRSLQAGKIIPQEPTTTVADGLRTSLGNLTFPIIQRLVERVIRVPDDKIVDAMRMIWERLKIVVEPSSAITLAAVLGAPDRFAGQRVGLILSGGNVDLDSLPW